MKNSKLTGSHLQSTTQTTHIRFFSTMGLFSMKPIIRQRMGGKLISNTESPQRTATMAGTSSWTK
ncbi:MAG: hypothetical protein IJ764_03410 [Bacteroidales bacterium]|nr:hypothetical protein [Bacteroidales bacterium]